MKHKLTLFTLLIPSLLLAGDVRLAWDASPTVTVTNYVLYAHTNILTPDSLTNAVVKVNVGTNLTVQLSALAPGLWSFAATAMADGLESDSSNILVVQVPAPPALMRTVAVQYSMTLTNFADLGFFRLRIE